MHTIAITASLLFALATALVYWLLGLRPGRDPDRRAYIRMQVLIHGGIITSAALVAGFLPF